MSSLHLTYLPKCLVAQVAPMYQHLSLRTADVSPRSSIAAEGRFARRVAQEFVSAKLDNKCQQ